MSRLDQLRRRVQETSARRRVAVAWPHDGDALAAVLAAAEEGLAEPVLVGDRTEIDRAADREELSIGTVPIVSATTPEEAARRTVELVRTGAAEVVMKGSLETAVLLSAILDQEHGLRTDRVLSHVAVFAVPDFPRYLVITDAAMNIAPTVEQKREIILNAVEVARAIGIDTPRVAMLCAKEKADPRMPATVEAEQLREAAAAGEIPGCVVSGPLAMDNAIDRRAAQRKGIDDPVAGNADILVAPDIEAANILYKALAFLTASSNAGIIPGARAPIVLTSRADSLECRINSIVLAALHARRTP